LEVHLKKYRVAVIGFAHVHASGMMEAFAQDERVEMAACADLPPAVPSHSMAEGTRGYHLALASERYGMKVYPDAAGLFATERIDIILSCAENVRHGAVAELAAKHGCHLVFEKPMATDYIMAENMVRVMNEAGKKLVINWPTAWSGDLAKARELISQGVIGRVLKLHYSNSSSLGPFSYGQNMTGAEMAAEWWYQPAEGGGAYMDYCGYGCMTSTWLIGERAVGAYGMRANLNSHFAPADDNGLVLARFPGAVATIEGTWSVVNAAAEVPLRVYGSEGTMAIYRDRIEIFKSRHGYEPDEVVEIEGLPEHRNNFAKDLLNCLETGEPLNPLVDIPLNLDAMALMDAGIRSAESGKFELAGDHCFSVPGIGIH
jgi:predicted dehydrogenase